eukprot:4383258-Pyramimonas_sp.AAC.1
MPSNSRGPRSADAGSSADLSVRVGGAEKPQHMFQSREVLLSVLGRGKGALLGSLRGVLLGPGSADAV